MKKYLVILFCFITSVCFASSAITGLTAKGDTGATGSTGATGADGSGGNHAGYYPTVSDLGLVANTLGTHQHSVSYPSASNFQLLSSIATTNTHSNYETLSNYYSTYGVHTHSNYAPVSGTANIVIGDSGNLWQIGSGVVYGSDMHSATDVNAKHFIGASPAPTVTVGSGAGALGDKNAKATVMAGTDLAGTVKVHTGTVPSTGVIFTLTFNTTYTTIPYVIVSPSHYVASSCGVAYAHPTTTTVNMHCSVKLDKLNSYLWTYHVIQ